MNNLVTVLLVFLFFNPNIVISQITENKDSQERRLVVKRILSVNDSDVLFKQLSENTLPRIKSEYRQRFKFEVETLVSQIKDEAIINFVKNYTVSELDIVYDELLSRDRSNRSNVTVKFTNEWRKYKEKFYNDFKRKLELYKEK